MPQKNWLKPINIKLLLTLFLLLGPLLWLGFMAHAIWLGPSFFKTVQVELIELRSQSYPYWSGGSRFSEAGMKQGQGYELFYRLDGKEQSKELSLDEAKTLRDRVPGSVLPLQLPAEDGYFALNSQAQGYGVLALWFAGMVLPVVLLLWAGRFAPVRWLSGLCFLLLLLLPFRVLLWD